jgi:hypothetical protein
MADGRGHRWKTVASGVAGAVVALVVGGVLAPTEVLAIDDGSPVHIVDSSNHVTRFGRSEGIADVRGNTLLTGVCDPRDVSSEQTDACAVVSNNRLYVETGLRFNSQGRVTVEAQPQVAQRPINDEISFATDKATKPFFGGPQGPAFSAAISSLTLTNLGADSVEVRITSAATPSLCETPSASRVLTTLIVGPDQSEHLPYPQPIVTHRPGNSGQACIDATVVKDLGSNPVDLHIALVGFQALR